MMKKKTELISLVAVPEDVYEDDVDDGFEDEKPPVERPDWTLRREERKWKPKDYMYFDTVTWPGITLAFPIDRRFKHNICSFGLPQFYDFPPHEKRDGDLVYLFDKKTICRDGRWRKCRVYWFSFTYCGRTFTELFYYDKKERDVSATIGRETLAKLMAFD